MPKDRSPSATAVTHLQGSLPSESPNAVRKCSTRVIRKFVVSQVYYCRNLALDSRCHLASQFILVTYPGSGSPIARSKQITRGPIGGRVRPSGRFLCSQLSRH